MQVRRCKSDRDCITLTADTVKAVFNASRNSLCVWNNKGMPLLMHSSLSVAIEDRDGMTVVFTPSGANSRIRIRRNQGYEVDFIPKNENVPEVFLLMSMTGDGKAINLQLGIKNATKRFLRIREFNLLSVNCLMAGRVVPHISCDNLVFYGYKALRNNPFPRWIEPELALYRNQYDWGQV